MKNGGLLIVCALILTAGCHKDESDVDRIMIKGKITSGTKSGGSSKGSQSGLEDAAKVLIFYGNRYDLAEINGSSFTAAAERGNPTALVFLDASNNYIGNLFAGGLNMLPLGNVDPSTTLIDLQNLTLDGTTVIPSHDPIGSEIDITPAEATRLRELGGFYESLAKNIDADNNGVPDILNKKELRINSQFTIFGGFWGLNGTAPVRYNDSQPRINYAVRIEGNISMAPTNNNNVSLSGPAEYPYDDIARDWYIADKDCFIAYFHRNGGSLPGDPMTNNYPAFKKGIYTFKFTGNDNYTLNYSNIDAGYYLVVATPTLHTDNNGNVTSVSLEYRLPDNTVIDYRNFVNILQLQIRKHDGSRVEIGGLYESIETNRTIKDFNNVQIPEQLRLTDINNMSVNYNDILGNEYSATWVKR